MSGNEPTHVVESVMELEIDAAVVVEEPGATEGSNLLQTFWGLSSLDEEERLGAARDLLLALTAQQVDVYHHVRVHGGMLYGAFPRRRRPPRVCAGNWSTL